VAFSVFDVTGRRVAGLNDRVHEAGEHQGTFALPRLAHGIYFLRMTAAGNSYTQRLALLRFP
jgi:hypothetical protein